MSNNEPRLIIYPKDAFENNEVCVMSEKPASKRGCYECMQKEEDKLLAYRLTEDLNIIYKKIVCVLDGSQG